MNAVTASSQIKSEFERIKGFVLSNFRNNRVVLTLVLALLFCLLQLPVACNNEENPLLGLWQLESGNMDVTHGKGITLLEFKSNGEIEISAEIPLDSEEANVSGEFKTVKYHTIVIKYEFLSQNKLALSTKQLGKTIKEEAGFSLEADHLTINGEKSGTLILIRR